MNSKFWKIVFFSSSLSNNSAQIQAGSLERIQVFERDPEASFETLQNSLQQAAQQNVAPGLGLISHAAILIKTSKHTVKAVDELREEIRRLDSKNGKLQSWVISLAVASLLATCVQTYVALRPPSPQVTAPLMKPLAPVSEIQSISSKSGPAESKVPAKTVPTLPVQPENIRR